MNNVIENIIDASTLSDTFSTAMTDIVDVDSDFASKALTDYITTSLDEHQNNDVVKIMTAAMQIASETGVLESPSLSPLQTAMTATNIVKNLNLSYLLEEGRIKAEQVADELIDQATANASVVAEAALAPETLKMGMDAALDAVSAAYPPAMPAAQFVKQFTAPVASFVSHTVKPVVQRGIQFVSQRAKQVSRSVISKCVNTTRSMASRVATKVLSFFR